MKSIEQDSQPKHHDHASQETEIREHRLLLRLAVRGATTAHGVEGHGVLAPHGLHP